MNNQINTREIIVQCLEEIFEEGGYNNLVLQKALHRNNSLADRDKHFITEVVNGTVRNLSRIDYTINQISKLPVKKMKPWIRNVLRMSVYQLVFLQVKDFAVCDEAVKLTVQRGYKGLKGFVNGVLRNIIRKEIKLPDKEENPVGHLAIAASHPEWMVQMWLQEYPFQFVQELCEANNKTPLISICVNTLKTNRDALQKSLQEEGVETLPGQLAHSLILQNGANFSKLSSFQQGLFHIMDETSMRCVDALCPEEEDHILDVCAAPGGKSFYIAEKMNGKGQVDACDIHPHKIALLQDGAQRLGLSNIQVSLQDAVNMVEDLQGRYDKVLVDAPCSGFGLLRKKPDIKWNKCPEDLESLVLLQRNILHVASAYVKDGGLLIYSTCTISKLENEENVQWFLENYPFQLEQHETLGGNGQMQFFPHVHGSDGFFIARFRKAV